MAIIIYIWACFNKWSVHRLHATDESCMNRTRLSFIELKFEFQNNGCCVGKQTGIVGGINLVFFCCYYYLSFSALYGRVSYIHCEILCDLQKKLS